MLARQRFENEYRFIFSEYKYGTTIWSPLAGGILYGKYNSGEIPEGSRYDNHKNLDTIWQKHMGPDVKDKTLKILNNLADISKDLGYTQAQLALAWAIASKDVSTCILGFTRLSQVEENLKSLELYNKWTPEIEKRVRDALGNDPEVMMDFRTWAPLANRRDVALGYAK
jgi:aryl-alcohol dehydrogenase-like predicted oxidoreductase